MGETPQGAVVPEGKPTMDPVGIDAHTKYSEIYVLSSRGRVLERRQVATTETSLRRFFAKRERSRLVMECGTVTPWLYRLLKSWGHEVIVVNPRWVRLIAESTLKSDTIDAEILARLSRFDGVLLGSVYQRSKAAQLLRTRLRVRTELVRNRTRLINSIRGTLRSHGYRMSRCETRRFVDRFVRLKVEDELRLVLDPLLEMIVQLNQQIAELSAQLESLSEDDELMVRLKDLRCAPPDLDLWRHLPRFSTDCLNTTNSQKKKT